MKCLTPAEVDMMRDPLTDGLLQVATSGVVLVGTQNLGNCYCEVRGFGRTLFSKQKVSINR
jgi:hypothetical protein